MKLKTTTYTEHRGEVYLSEHDLAVIIGKFLGDNAPEVTVDMLDFDVSQGGVVKGVSVRWTEVEQLKEEEKEI